MAWHGGAWQRARIRFKPGQCIHVVGAHICGAGAGGGVWAWEAPTCQGASSAACGGEHPKSSVAYGGYLGERMAR